MIVQSSKWQEAGKNDVCLQQQVGIGPFLVLVEVGYNYNHDFLAGRGVLLEHWQENTLKNPYCGGSRGERYYLPNTTVMDLACYYVKQDNLTPDVASARASKEVKEGMDIALSPHHAGYEAFSVLTTVRMWVETGDSSDLITLARRAVTGIEIQSTGNAYDEAGRAVPSFGLTRLELARQELAVKGEELAITAITASIDIIRHIKRHMKTGHIFDILEEIGQDRVF